MAYRGLLSLQKIHSKQFELKTPIEVVVEKSEEKSEVCVIWEGAGVSSCAPDIHQALEQFQKDLEHKAEISFAATADQIRPDCLPRLEVLLAHVAQLN